MNQENRFPPGAQPHPGRKSIPAIHNSLTCLLMVFAALLAPCANSSAQDQPDSAARERPNFLLIVADDLGYSDIGAYGGEIDTPHLDQLARSGMKFTDFHVSPTCSPTRAMLLTGNDSHVSGLGSMAEALQPEQRGRPGYEGYLNQSVATIAERLKSAGYFTAMAGKWHLGGAPGQLPAARGFDRSFALLNGAANYYGKDQGGPWAGTLFEARYAENGERSRLPEGAYTTDYFTTRLLEFLTAAAADQGRPWFAYLAFNAPHTPLQAPRDLIEKYGEMYADGPVELRERRVRRMQQLGILAPDVQLPPMLDTGDWATMAEGEKLASSRRMRVYAAAVDRMDQNIGRLMDGLRGAGLLENTTIIFLSDNGAEGTDEDYWLGFLAHLGLPAAIAGELRAANADVTQVGTAASYPAYGPGWAQAGMAPFSLTKGFTTEGGIRAPLIITGPGIPPGDTSRSLAHVTDLVPTMLELAGVPVSPDVNGRAVRPPQGVSLAATLRGGDELQPGRSLGWELFGRRAVRHDQWKAVYMNKPSIARGSGTGAADWQLFDLDSDPGETADLAATKPEILQGLLQQWDTYQADNGVVPVPPLGERAQPAQPGTRPQ